MSRSDHPSSLITFTFKYIAQYPMILFMMLEVPDQPLTHSMLGKNFQYSVSLGDNMHEMSKPKDAHFGGFYSPLSSNCSKL